MLHIGVVGSYIGQRGKHDDLALHALDVELVAIGIFSSLLCDSGIEARGYLIISISRGKKQEAIYFVVEIPPLLKTLLLRASLDWQNKVRICVLGVSLGLTTALVPFALSYERGLFLSV